jgi:hypothetical protein
MGIRNYNLRGSQVRKIGKIGLYQSLKHLHPFPHSYSNFLFAPLQLSI